AGAIASTPCSSENETSRLPSCISRWSNSTPSAVVHSLVAVSKFSGRTQYTTWLIRLGCGSISLSSSLRDHVSAQLVLQYFADLIARQSVERDPLLGNLLDHEPSIAQIGRQPFDRQRLRWVGRDDDCAASLTAHGVGHSDHRYFTHRWVFEE